MTSFSNITVWAGLGAAEHAAIATGGAWNAFYFARRAVLDRGGRRLAAAVLALLFASITLEVLTGSAASAASEVALRAPLTLALLAVTTLTLPGSRAGSRR
ncbi:MAG: hypothetical protein O2919_04955 [Chloroflexi bacterium]|nr:hypothetical protein [Chloroflexota bacterium]